MPEQSVVYPPLDLSRYSEATRRALYERIVAIQFTPHEPASADPRDAVPYLDPEDARLTIVYLFGRWFAYWLEVPEPGLPEWRLTELVRIQAAPDLPEGIILHEV